MWKSIDVNKLDKLLEEYREFGHEKEGEMFSDFIKSTTDDEFPVWDYTDSIGIVTPEDFKKDFSMDFIEHHFEELANLWYKGLNTQVDFGILLECVKDEAQNIN